ncbi:hypothetical protein NAPIS_ORF01078 [Vairimorpha apis BRL 01]|uniref:Uncharacterized protein n=1 Tax=Vairimorpha apis BRL 01 TaxID=1037528 RepID=T0MK16_9MICR|nr:hypothetical protein NAPIS_ORF01078 [Vairimorpha apis BRL 01]
MKFFSLDKTILKSDPYYKNRLLIIKKLDFDELNDFLNDQNDEILKFVLKELYLRYCVNKDIFEKNLFNDEICINGEKYENSEILSKLSRLILHQNYNIRILASKLIFTFVKNDELLYILDKKIESNIGDMLLERTQIIDVDISKKSEILLKENLKKFLNGEPFNNIYKMKNDVLDYYLFLKDLYKALLKNSKSKILQLNKKYQNVDFSDNILNDKKIF